MRAILLLAFTSVCPALIPEPTTQVKDVSIDSTDDDNSVFAAEEALRRSFASASKSASQTVTANVTVNSSIATSAAVSGGGSVRSISQPKAVSWQAQHSKIKKSGTDDTAKLHTERILRKNSASTSGSEARQEAEMIATTKSTTKSEAARKSKGKVEQEKSSGSANAHKIFALDTELATKGELAEQQNTERKLEDVGQFRGNASWQSLSYESNAEFSKVDKELKATMAKLNSLKEALTAGTQSLNVSLASLRKEKIRRANAESTSRAQAVSLEQMRVEVSQQALALAAINATGSKVTAELRSTRAEHRSTRAQLRSVSATKASEAARSAAQLRSELDASNAESEELKQKLGRVVKMVQSDLADKDRQASELLDSEHARTVKVLRDIAGQENDLKDLRTQSAKLAEENYKLRARIDNKDQ